MNTKKMILVALATALAIAGCTTDDVARRTESRDATVDRLREETTAYFATNPAPMTLERAVDVARERTLKLTQARLDASLANISKGMAFSSFLPRLDARYMYARTSKDLESESIMGHSLYLGDHAEAAQLAITQPLFVPNAWLMFFEARHLEKAQLFRLERARQLLDVQVTAQFYESAVADALIRAYESETNSTAALLKQVEGLQEEGFATKPDLARVRTKLLSDEHALKAAGVRAEMARARLADILRFRPANLR